MISNSELLSRMTIQQREELAAEWPARRAKILAEIAVELAEEVEDWRGWEMSDELGDKLRDEARDRRILYPEEERDEY